MSILGQKGANLDQKGWGQIFPDLYTSIFHKNTIRLVPIPTSTPSYGSPHTNFLKADFFVTFKSFYIGISNFYYFGKLKYTSIELPISNLPRVAFISNSFTASWSFLHMVLNLSGLELLKITPIDYQY